MDKNQTTDKNHPKHPISIHDMDIDANVIPATIWWRSERNEWPVLRALLVWMIYEKDPPVMYSADNLADANAFDKFVVRVLEYSQKLYKMQCPVHGGIPAFINGERERMVYFRCSLANHYYIYSLMSINRVEI